MVHLPQLAIGTDDIPMFGNELTWGETTCLENLEFIADRFDNLSFAP
jgi:hypothetical protein